MIPSPIRKALSLIRKRRVDHLLMGGQACVLYGAAEFSRDLDLVLLPDPDNLHRFELALTDLQAEVIAIPPFLPEHLADGLAVHFRCLHPEASGLRIDVMTRLRGVDDFSSLWDRRTTMSFGEETLDLLSLPDLVAAKKTQRDKDWPMIRRLVDANYLMNREAASPKRVEFWLLSMRTPELLLEIVRRFPEQAARLSEQRRLLRTATGDAAAVEALGKALRDEEEAERKADADYWRPLRQRLAEIRRNRRQAP